MPEKVADVCDVCGKTVVKNHRFDSSGMVVLNGQDGWLLLLADVPKGESGRPSFTLTGKLWCPPCLILALSKWLGL